MKADWVAASVRARSMATHRSGAGRCRRIAAQPTLDDALALLADSPYAARLTDAPSLETAQRATRETVLWQLRVLAGWLPAAGTRLVRAAAAAFERDNILALARALEGGRPAPPPFELGAVATAWPRVRTASSLDELVGALRTSSWGDPGTAGTTGLEDALTVTWLRSLADVAPAARAWAESASALIVARTLLVDRARPSARLRQLVRPLIGTAWETADSLTSLRAALPPAARDALDGVEADTDLWRAEAGLRATVEADGFALLRTSLPGPRVVLGAMTVLAIDAWRVRAALADAAAGTGTSEVLDVVA